MTSRTIKGSYPGGYYLKPAFATLDIAASAYVGGAGVTTSATAASTIDNRGTVIGAGAGITLADGGPVINGAATDKAALISGATPIVADMAAASLTNFGSITSTGTASAYGTLTEVSVLFDAGGAVTNEFGGEISSGVSIGGGAGAVINEGSIGGAILGSTSARSDPSGHSVSLSAGGKVTNGSAAQTAAVLSSGVYISGGAGSVTNLGEIDGASGGLSQPYGNGNYAYYVFQKAAVSLSSGGSVTNGSAAAKTAKLYGSVDISGGEGAVVNNGTIWETSEGTQSYAGAGGVTDYSITMAAGGAVTNGSASNTTAAIMGGVVVYGAPGRVTNFGVIGAPQYYGGHAYTTGYSVQLIGGGDVTNGGASSKAAVIEDGVATSNGVVRNFGTIGDFALNGYYAVAMYDGRVVNGAAGDTTAAIAGGVHALFGVTVTNFGAIGLADRSAFTFSDPSDTLIEEGSGVLMGAILGGGGRLVLAAGDGAGTLAGLGGSITGFAVIDVEAGAGWRLTGANTIAKGETLRNASAVIDQGTLTNDGFIFARALLQLASGAEIDNAAGGDLLIQGDTGVGLAPGATGTSLINAGVLEKQGGAGTSDIETAVTNTGDIVVANGVLELAAAVSGPGAFRIAAGATLQFGSAVATGSRVTFAGADGVLELSDAGAFAGRVGGFAAGVTLDLRSLHFGTITKVSYAGAANSGTLTVASGARIANIALLGQYAAANFAASSDGHGGTDITFVPTPVALATITPPQ